MKVITSLFAHTKPELSTANLFLRQKYSLNCLFTLEDQPGQTKPIAFETIESLSKNYCVSLDAAGS